MPVRPLTPGLVSRDIAKIIHSDSVPSDAVTHRIIINTPDDNLSPTELISIEISRDYCNNISDFTLVTFSIMLGDYVKLIHPYMDNLEMTIVTTEYSKNTHIRYKMVILKGIEGLTGSMYSSYTRDELNKVDKVIVEAQCVDRLVETIRTHPVDGIYAYTTIDKVIKTIFNSAISNIKVDGIKKDYGVKIDGIPEEYNIDVIEPNNSKKYRHISIPMGVRLLDMPSFLQETNYGVYSSGIGTYIQRYSHEHDRETAKSTIFVYPIYHSGLWDTPGKKLMILSAPTNIMSVIENSYIVDGDVIKIIGNGNVTSKEESQNLIKDVGNVIITTKTDSMILDSVSTKDKTVHTSKKDNLIADRLSKMRDGTSNVNYIKPTSNPYVQYSKVASNMLSSYTIKWMHSNPTILYPGMPVSYIYEDADHGIVKLNGILHSNFTKYNTSDRTHVTILNVLLEPYIDNIKKGIETVNVRR